MRPELEQRALAVYAAFRLALLAWASWSVRLVMDEMALIQQVVYFEKLYEGVDPIKTVLAIYFFNSPRLVTSDAVSLLFGARILGFLVAAVSAGAILVASRAVAGSWRGGLIGLATLLTFSNFAERAFRIRTDMAQSMFAALALAAVLACRRPSTAAWVAGLASGLAFLCTQKAIYVAIGFGLGFLLAEDWRRGGWRLALAQTARFSVAWAGTALAYSLAFGGLQFVSVLRAIFEGPTRFALSTLGDYEGLERYRYISLRHNVLLYLLTAAGLVWIFLRWQSQSRGVRVAAVATAVVVPLALFHYQPWPYVFVLPQVFLAPWAAAASSAGLSMRMRSILTFALLGALLLSLPRALIYPAVHTNESQLQEIRSIEAMLAPEDTYFDGLGMIPTRFQAGGAYNWWWDRPALHKLAREIGTGDQNVVEAILADHPKVWILNYRTMAIMKLISPSLMNSYVRATPSVLVSGIELAPGERERRFLCTFPGRYRFYGRDGLPLGDPVSTGDGEAAVEIDLAAGWHLLRRANAESAAVLMPTSLRLKAPLPSAEEPVPDYFLNVYDF